MASAPLNLNQVEKTTTNNKCGNSSCGCGQGSFDRIKKTTDSMFNKQTKDVDVCMERALV